MSILRMAPFAALALAVAAAAQTVSGTSALPQTSAGCELHVWAAPGLESLTEGWLNQSRNQALRDKAGNRTAIADTLDPAAQLETLAALDLPAKLHLAGARLIGHAEPLPPAEPGAPAARHDSSGATCYAELVVRHLVFARTALAGAALQGSFQFRVFGPDAAPTRSFSSIASASLMPDPSLPSADPVKAATELRDAFGTIMATFAGYAVAPPKPRKRMPAQPVS